MPQVEAPLTGGKVSSSDVSGSAVSIVKAMGGVGLMTVILAYGQEIGNAVQRRIGAATGVQTSEQGPSIQVA